MTGRTWYELSVKIPLFYDVKQPAGEESRSFAVLWGEKRAKLSIKGTGNLSTECDKIISRKQWTLPGGLVLPVTWVTETRIPYETVHMERSRESARELGSAALERYLASQLGEGGEIVSTRVADAVQGDWLLVTLSAECHEQIGKVVPIYQD